MDGTILRRWAASLCPFALATGLLAFSGGVAGAQVAEEDSSLSNGPSSAQESEDAFFSLDIGGLIQARYIANVRDGAEDVLGESDEQLGFQLRRARVFFEGHVVKPEITYKLRLAGSRGSGSVGVEVARVGYRFSDGLEIHAGRFKEPFLREETISSSRQLTAERSLVNSVFTSNYVEGVTVLAQPSEALAVRASITDGLRSGETGGPENDFPDGTADVAFSGRVDARLSGDWNQTVDYSSWPSEGSGLFLGGAIHYEKTKDAVSDVSGTGDVFTYSADALLKSGGLGVFGALVGRRIDVVDNAGPDALSDLGLVAQAGYQAIPDRLEPFARYEWIDPDEDRGFEDMNLITLGANAYLMEHRAKLTLDVVWALEELNAFAFTKTPASPLGNDSQEGLGLLPDAPGQDGQVAVRAQFQVKL